MDPETNGSNDQLKNLYDASVGFKNDLANLRGSIKSLTAKTTAYTSKCDDFNGELEQLFELNKTLQDENKKDGPKTVSMRLDLEQKQKQMREIQSTLVNVIHQ